MLTGRADQTVDTEGRINQTFFDALGRTVKTVANAIEGGTETDQNITIETTYTSDSQIKTLTAKNSSTGDQVTKYIYGTVQSSVVPMIYSNRLLAAEIYPDADENSLDDRIEFCYNRQGELIRKRDQNGSVHLYEYDLHGRMIAERVTTLGLNADGTVRCIATEYTVAGQIRAITSLDGENNVVNQIVYQYDQNGQLQREYTAHHGTVDITSTPFIGYGYDTITNGLRQISVTYPSGKIVSYEYDNYGRLLESMTAIIRLPNIPIKVSVQSCVQNTSNPI
jgi:YD repeat-containing protein